MPSYPTPTGKELRRAFADHGVEFEVHPRERSRDSWAHGLRAATVHHTAGKNSVGHLATAWSLPGCNAVIQHGGYNGRANDGKAVILAWGSAFHSGAGGPWKGIAGEDSLHLVSWGIEIESLGTREDMSDRQIETTGRMLAALVDVGMPVGNIHRHADWTDATGPVTGPLRVRRFDSGSARTTRGRKIDTNKRWYPTSLWVEQAGKYLQADQLWDGVVPDIEGIYGAEAEGLANPAAWRLACRLADLGHYSGTVKPRGEQGYPAKAVASWQQSIGADPTGRYGPKAHARIFDA